jgi:hypothetical protein
VQHRELLVHLGDPRLGITDQPEREAGNGEHDRGNKGSGD